MSYTLTTPPLMIDAGTTGSPEYTGADMRRLIGGLMISTADDVTVARTGATDQRAFRTRIVGGRQVVVDPGTYVIGTKRGAYFVTLDEVAEIGTLSPADATNPRYDRVVLRIDDPDTSGGEDRQASLEIVEGTPAPAPAVEEPEGTPVWVETGRTRVEAGVTPSMSDLRTFTAAAGGVTTVSGTSEMDRLAKPAGALVWNSSTKKLSVSNGTSWQPVAIDQDTGWLTFSPKSPFKLYGSEPLQYRKRNGIVEIMGAVTPTRNLGGLNGEVIGTIPAGFRHDSAYNILAICQGSGTARWVLQVTPGGDLKAYRYSGTANSGVWMIFHITYVAAE